MHVHAITIAADSSATLAPTSAPRTKIAQILAYGVRQLVIVPQCFRANRECALMQRFGLVQATLRFAHSSEVAESLGHVPVTFAEPFLQVRQRAREQVLGVLVTSLAGVQCCE